MMSLAGRSSEQVALGQRSAILASMAKQSGDDRMRANQGGAASMSQADAAGSPTDLERAQIYALIDSILPFEACLYYQVAPLSIDGSCLTMGTVDPDDPAAAEYVTKQLSYINYSIRFQKIASDWHRDLLSQYLKHNAESQRQANAANAEAAKAAEAEKAAAEAAVDAAAGASVSSFATEAAIAHEPAPHAGAAISDEQLQATLILEQVEEMTAMLPRDVTSQLVAEEQRAAALADVFEPTTSPVLEEARTVEPPPAETVEPEIREAAPPKSEETPSVMVPPPPAEAPSAEVPPAEAPPAEAPSAEAPAAPATDEAHDDDISRLLCALPPKVLMQALLDKVIGDGIGRLYLKRHGHTHQILWSRNGVLEGLIEPVDSQVLQAVINEFKQLTHATLAPVTQPKQVEIERTQDGERILLRLKLLPGDETEQATLQVLRGAALEFHQQYQIDSLSRDALDAAQTLKARLNDMRDRARKSLNFQPSRSKTLKALVKLLKELDIQMQEIEAAYHAHEDE